MAVEKILHQCRPAVGKCWLHFIAGMLWTMVGVMLLNLAFGWLKPLGMSGALVHVFAGILLALGFYFFTFSKLACKNLGRIEKLEAERTCIFAFQTWKSYPLIVFMIALGVTLRHFTPIPKPFLAIAYTGVGGGLFLSSLLYYGHLLHGRVAGNAP